MKLALLERALAASRTGRPAALVTHVGNGQQTLLLDGVAAEGNLALDEALRGEIARAAAEDRSQLVETAAGAVFIEIFNPRLRLVLVGAVHIAQPLARIGALAGYAVTVVDPRSAFASGERFPEVTLVTEWPDEALAALQPDRRTAIVTLTHDPKLDDPALVAALGSDAFYIGALGSRKTHAGRCKRLAKHGFTEADFARIHGPVGLNIGAISPAEIAVAIMAEITQTLRAERKREREAA
jgi:xanthine dehydrogenase accessory factor